MIIKVCGMRNAENIRNLEASGIADWMGLIFFSKSSRNVAKLPEYLPTKMKRVGVFVNADEDMILEKTQAFSLNLVQLHGNETPDYCQHLRNKLPSDVKIIKMIQVATENDINCAFQYQTLVDYLLFETKCQSYGGSGTKFDWTLLNSYDGQTPFLLTGGIGPDDADAINSFHHPRLAGIDLNSKFETEPAFKDIELLIKFKKSLV